MINTVEHVRERNGEYYVAKTRVPVGVVIASWKRGVSPEHISEQFPTLTLADVYGVITYYLDHRPELEAHFALLEKEFEEARLHAHAERREFYHDLRQRSDEWRAAHPHDESGE